MKIVVSFVFCEKNETLLLEGPRVHHGVWLTIADVYNFYLSVSFDIFFVTKPYWLKNKIPGGALVHSTTVKNKVIRICVSNHCVWTRWGFIVISDDDILFCFVQNICANNLLRWFPLNLNKQISMKSLRANFNAVISAFFFSLLNLVFVNACQHFIQLNS